jgi:hypothetical protein
MGDVVELLDTRAKTHGDYADVARLAQIMKGDFRYYGVKFEELTMAQKEALDMIASKIGRILSGDPNEIDHWRDIAGYAQLVVRELEAGK